MGTKPIHRRTDVLLEGKKSDSRAANPAVYIKRFYAMFYERYGTEGAACKGMGM